MPFKAYVDGKVVISSFISKDEWDEIKKMKLPIKMHCCENDGYMKRNKYGTQFFVHNNKKNCNYKPESAEHLALKDEIAKCLHKNGCDFIDVERKGPDWIADIYAEHRGKKYAFEIQISKIDRETIIERSKKYVNSGIHPVWILKKNKNFNFDHKNKWFSFNCINQTIELSDYLEYFRKDGIIVTTVNNFDEVLIGNTKIDALNDKTIELDCFLNEIISGEYALKCSTEIDNICRKYALIKSHDQKLKQASEIDDLYILDNGTIPTCPNCGGKLKKECVIHRSHYFQGGIRCTSCFHFEGIEDHIDYYFWDYESEASPKCPKCGQTGLIVPECRKDNANNTFQIGALCLNCNYYRIECEGSFEDELTKYILKGQEFSKKIRRKQF